MNNKIKNFIGTDAKAAVLGNESEAGRILAESLELVFDENLSCWIKRGVCFASDSISIVRNLNLVYNLELATIEKVGADVYGKALMLLTVPAKVRKSENNADRNYSIALEYHQLIIVATTDAPTRCAAMLTALADKEIL